MPSQWKPKFKLGDYVHISYFETSDWDGEIVKVPLEAGMSYQVRIFRNGFQRAEIEDYLELIKDGLDRILEKI